MKPNRHPSLWAVSLALLITSAGCDGNVTEPAFASIPDGKAAPSAVASVAVSPAELSLVEGDTVSLSAVAKDAAGAALTGRAVAWSSSDPTVATVSAAGLVTALRSGAVSVTASVEGKSASSSVGVKQATIARLSLSPTYRATSTGQVITFSANPVDARGRAVQSASVRWTSADPQLVAVDQQGQVSAREVGVARVVASADQVTDTAVVAVLGAKSLLMTALPEGTLKASAAAGQTVSVPVVLDVSQVSSTGDLGSIQFDVTFDPKLLEYVSYAVGVSGSAAANQSEPGRIRFAFASTDPQGQASLKLLTLNFKVASGATGGAQASLGVSFSGRPTSTGFQAYESPLTVAGSVLVK